MVNETDNSEQKTRAAALFALALKQNSDKNRVECPDENTIARYCDDQLNAHEREQFREDYMSTPILIISTIS